MEMFVVKGGRPLRGEVRVSGAKNAALPIMAAALAVRGEVKLLDVPDLVDVTTLGRLLESLGVDVSRQADGGLLLATRDQRPYVAEYELVRRMRAGVCVLGPLLAGRRRACVSLPGGCNIGARPIDLHLKGLRALGADIRIERGYVVAEARRLRGTSIFLGGPFGSTVTGTCNVMCAAALAEGVTTIESAACEPEVVDLGNFLNAAGARISGLGTPFLRIEGVDRLEGTVHRIIPDRIEAATLMIAAAITGGRILLKNARLDHMTAVIEKLTEIGVRVEIDGQKGSEKGRQEPENLLQQPERSAQPGMPECRGIPRARIAETPHRAAMSRRSTVRSPVVTVAAPPRLQPADVIALPYPGIPTDVQAQLMALLTRAEGISVVTDKVFPDRFMHAAELARMGANIRRELNSAVISGIERLSGASVMASDLRASAALVLAAMAAEGESVVRRIYHLDRGYDRLEQKLNRLGADIRRTSDEPANMPRALAAAEIGELLDRSARRLIPPERPATYPLRSA